MLYRGDLISPYIPLRDINSKNRWLSGVCLSIQDVLYGREAQSILDSDEIPDSASLAALPMWLWMVPEGQAMGAKSDSHMPARINYDRESCLVIVKPDDTTDWSAHGPGMNRSGTITIEASEGDRDDMTAPGNTVSLPESLACRTKDRDSLVSDLTGFVKRGEKAWWGLLMEIDGFVRRSVEKMHAAATRELFDTLGVGEAGFLDSVSIEEVVGDITLGEGDKPSKAMKVIEKLLEPSRFDKVDPQRYMNSELTRTAGQQIRSRIGDTPIGSKIRRVISTLPDGTPEEHIIQVYRDQHPKDKLGVERFRKALDVRPDISMLTSPIPHEDILPPCELGDRPAVVLGRERALSAIEEASCSGVIDIESARKAILEAVDIECLDDDLISDLIDVLEKSGDRR